MSTGQLTLNSFADEQAGQCSLTDFRRHLVDAHSTETADLAEWQPRAVAPATCARCGHDLGPSYARVWRNNEGIVDGCHNCLPRSVRYGEDVYGRSKDEAEKTYHPPPEAAAND